MPIGTRVRDLRAKTGMSVPEAAAKAGIARVSWWQIEAGERQNVGTDTLRKIAAALGCTVAELLGEDAPTPLTPLQKRALGFLEQVPPNRIGDWFAEAGRLAAGDQEAAEDFAVAMMSAAS